MYNISADTKSFYIHWPFCPYKCHFCPFVAIASQDEYMHDYHNALLKELENFLKAVPEKQVLETVYLGGGTPSTYPENLLLDTFGRLRKYSHLSMDAEISIEINPGTVTKQKLELWKYIGINRLSLGVQSLNNKVLTELNRHQSKDQVLNFLDMAAPLFENISVDLIIGLPGITDLEWKDLIAQIVTWPIKHVSIYFLTVHENTPLFFGVKNKKIKLPDEERIVDLFLWTILYLKKFGFEQYETSSFSKSGFESKHNSIYWSHKPYKGFGLGACSFDGKVRYQNEKNLMEYMKKVNTRGNEVVFSEQLNFDQFRLEKIMLGLRQTKKGLDLNYIFEGMTADKINFINDYLTLLENRGLIKRNVGKVYLTPAGVILENEIAVVLSN